MAGRLLVIGDVIDDIIVVPEGGIRANTDTSASIAKTLGGSAANVAAWAALGEAFVEFIGCVGDQDLARNQANFAAAGVAATLQTSTRPTGSIVVLVAGADRSMLTDRGANQDLQLDAIDAELEGLSVLYLSGYALLGKSEASVVGLISRAKSNGAIVAIDPGSTGFIRDYGVAEYRALLAHADVCFPNEEEAELLALKGVVPLVVITKGSSGAVAQWSNGAELSVAGLKVESVDPTGAGDAFCGAFLARVASAAQPSIFDQALVQEALTVGVSAGARAVETLGARPSL